MLGSWRNSGQEAKAKSNLKIHSACKKQTDLKALFLHNLIIIFFGSLGKNELLNHIKNVVMKCNPWSCSSFHSLWKKSIALQLLTALILPHLAPGTRKSVKSMSVCCHYFVVGIISLFKGLINLRFHGQFSIFYSPTSVCGMYVSTYYLF